ALVLLARPARAGRVAGRAGADRLTGRGTPGTDGGRRGRPGSARPLLLLRIGTQPERGCLLDLHRRAGTRVAVDRRRRVLQRPRGLPRPAQPLGLDLDRRLGTRQRYRVRLRRGGRRALLDLNLQVEEEPDRLLLDAVEHLAEHVEALALVLDQRVALGVRAQADALLEVVHLVEVLAPLAVDDREQHLALQLAHGLRAQLILALLVGGVRVLDQPGLEEVGIQLVGAAAGLLDHVLDRHADRVQLLEAGPELVEIPVLGVPLRRRPGDVGAGHVVDHVPYLLVQVFAVEYPPTLGVDHLALLVEYLVVLEDVLADLRV